MRQMVLAAVTGMAGLSAHAAPVGVIPSVVQATVDILYLPLAGLARSGYLSSCHGVVSALTSMVAFPSLLLPRCYLKHRK